MDILGLHNFSNLIPRKTKIMKHLPLTKYSSPKKVNRNRSNGYIYILLLRIIYISMKKLIIRFRFVDPVMP